MRQITRNGIDQILFQHGNGGTAEIFDIAVHSNRGQGIGTDLVNSAINELGDCKRIFAFTRKENTQARNFYKKLGFKETVVPNFYPDGDAVIVVKEI